MRLALVAAGALILALPAAGGGFPRFGAGCSRDDFSSGGASVRAELFTAHGGFSTGSFGAGSHGWPGRQGALGIAHAATVSAAVLDGS